MKLSTVFAGLTLLHSCGAYALDVGEINVFIPTNTNKVTKEIKNTSNSGRFVRIEVEKISSPLASGQVIEMDSKNEILFTPANLVLPVGTDNLVTFIYNGPQDNIERYYRLVWTEESLNNNNPYLAGKSATITTSITLQTILVVSPRKEIFSHQLTKGKLTNTGNASYQVDAYGTCLDKSKTDTCKETYFVLPGNSQSFKLVDANDDKSHVVIWHNQEFTPAK
ncbi:hypothetical protein [Yersinia mollaretii]|nr:hypothetical protein [Yersinia mollaretii]MDN0111392.1 hypothetical protein [Yersinia mollaretii]PJE88301.1 hypothetical protein CU280_09170 [Yersinia mollaretii]CQD43310.1 putative fimbrial protein TcfA [Yersinia mollaretii]CQH06623.1 putative fimbrial protein TcfA [Yersinia mollaretii]